MGINGCRCDLKWKAEPGSTTRLCTQTVSSCAMDRGWRDGRKKLFTFHSFIVLWAELSSFKLITWIKKNSIFCSFYRKILHHYFWLSVSSSSLSHFSAQKFTSTTRRMNDGRRLTNPTSWMSSTYVNEMRGIDALN